MIQCNQVSFVEYKTYAIKAPTIKNILNTPELANNLLLIAVFQNEICN